MGDYEVIKSDLFDPPLVGGHLSNLWKGHAFAIPKRSPAELLGGCLGVYVGDEMLPSYVGIIMNHYKDLY